HRLHHQAQLLLAAAQRLFLLAPLGQVAGDLGVALQLAVRIAQRGDHHAGPEARAVLADAPAFVLDAALLAGAAQLFARPAGGDLVGWVEALERLADDLRCRVALDALRAGIPARHAAVGVEQEDGVVADAVDEQAEAFLGGPHEAAGRRSATGGIAVGHRE